MTVIQVVDFMTSVLVYANGPEPAAKGPGPEFLELDLQAAGFTVLAVVRDCAQLVQRVLRHTPDLVICALDKLDAVFFKTTQAIADAAPCPVLVFTSDLDVAHIEQSMASGVHAYVMDGYARHRLQSLVQLAQARFRHEQAAHATLLDLSGRLEERKVIDRAKTILMRARALSDDDAFRLLRTASMHSNQRLGQVSQHIIHSAHFAEGVNRAGQLRMLSQRLVKLYLLKLLQPTGDAWTLHRHLFDESAQRIDANLTLLDKNFSKYRFADVLAQTGITWVRLKQALQAAPVAREMAHVDDLAEQLLKEAERLTISLENEGATAPLQVLNMAGRQRMLSQRFAKFVLLGALGEAKLVAHGDAGMAATRMAFEQAQHYLHNLPLSTPDIRRALEAAKLGWQNSRSGAERVQRPDGQAQLALASEELLGVLEQLSATYESSMQMLMG